MLTVCSRRDDTHGHRQAIAIDDGIAWVLSWEAEERPGKIDKIDLGTGRVLSSARVGFQPRGLVVAKSSVWVTNLADGTLMRIDPDTVEVSRTLAVGFTSTIFTPVAEQSPPHVPT